ncbi:AbiJ-related protein [Microcoleus sp. B9-D4]|uniref:AbiJ-related protein n=1 Tax=Microcoleus sp. B9-D4 TaxID=2818711 RepID=UPI002FD6965C
MRITELTRRNIIEALLRKNIYGRLELFDFLNLTWNLSEMPSTDSRFENAAGDIWQHMVNNNDWEEDYLFFRCLDILQLPDQRFLHFLEQVIHPIVRASETQAEYAELINSYLVHDGYRLNATEQMSGCPVYKATRLQGGVPSRVKNLIFASNGHKPEIVLVDAVNNDIRITRNEKNCLVYEESVPSSGLSWSNLVQWWAALTNTDPISSETEKSLRERLSDSLESEPERLLFNSYFQRIHPLMQEPPALIPQIYLHYDPYTVSERNGQKVLPRQRMDFLLLLPNSQRVVIEVDGKQHYANKDTASPRLYAEMVAADRELKLSGYEVYRFGGYELQGDPGKQVVEDFFRKLFVRHGLL